ncbi:ABC transporter permease [Anaerolineales bacterium HSG6]|nr:ABC transporter permease [Anaerolineales bacterium HSG6]MDM8529828.1 ABC transporter permease [Anaerolineales bacterium HSG25]
MPTVIFEKRVDDIPKWLPFVTSMGSVVIAFVISGFILWLLGGQPFVVGQYFFEASFGSWAVFSDTMVKATPLILVGLACTVAFKMKLWNIGAEGQFYLGAFAASLVVLVPLVPAGTPKPIVLLVMMIMGMLGGALWGLIPGYLKAYFNINEIITTLMLNYVAIQWNNFWIFNSFSDAGFQMTPSFDKSAWLPRLADYARQYRFLSGMTLHLGVVIALVATVVVWWILARSRWGYEINLIGDNPLAARYAGLNIKQNIVLVMMFSGALAGLAGMAEVSGVVHRLQERISPGYGFTGIIIAWLAKLNPFAVIPVSILFGALILAGREIQPSGLANMLQGFILFMVISSDVLLRYKIKLVRPTVQEA